MTGMILYSNHLNFLSVSNKTVLLFYHSYVHWSSTFSFLQELFLSIYNLANWCKMVLQPISAFDMPSLLSLISSSYDLK